jgi:SAM-dependent methyltransferase
MTLTLETLAFLASPAGETLLNRLTAEDLSEANTLRLLTALRREYAPEQAGAALEMARLRLKAVDKFGADAARLFFTRPALEQASDPRIRDWRTRNTDVVGQDVVDGCCGIGADSLAFARGGASVLGLDIDPLRVEIARLNAAALGLITRFEVADVSEGLPPCNFAFFDPARRDDAGNRIFDVEQYQPPLSIVKGWRVDSIQVKLSPGVDVSQLRDYLPPVRHGSVSFISVDGALKEALLRLGGAPGRTTAVLLKDGNAYEWVRGEVDTPSVVAQPRAWLVEPDPALIRAGLVADAAAKFGGWQLDETIAYFTTDGKPASPWMRAWKILDWMPFNGKRLRAYLGEHNVGNVTVKKRGSAVTPEVLIPQLKLRGSEARTLVLTRCQGEQIVLVCEAVPG